MPPGSGFKMEYMGGMPSYTHLSCLSVLLRDSWGIDRLCLGSLNYNSLSLVDSCCREEGKWPEVPYIQAFFLLRDQKDTCAMYSTDDAFLAMMSQNITGLEYPQTTSSFLSTVYFIYLSK